MKVCKKCGGEIFTKSGRCLTCGEISPFGITDLPCGKFVDYCSKRVWDLIDAIKKCEEYLGNDLAGGDLDKIARTTIKSIQNRIDEVKEELGLTPKDPQFFYEITYLDDEQE